MGLKCHTYVHQSGLAAAVIADKEYEPRVAFGLIAEVMRIFQDQQEGKWEKVTKDTPISCPDVDDTFRKFQDPANADKLTKIQKDLDDVHQVVQQTMGDLMQRGESLNALIDKSNDLSQASKQFRRTAESNN